MKRDEHALNLGPFSIKRVERDVYRVQCHKGLEPVFTLYTSLNGLRKRAYILMNFIKREEKEGGER